MYGPISPSTEGTDHREKLPAYLQISSLEMFLLIHQDERRVEWYRREGPAWWQGETLDVGSINVPCLNIELSLDTIYANLVPPVPPPTGLDELD